jgi:hypothetical protein
MSLLPTAHAGQSFGTRRIDFFTVSGHVGNSEASTGHVIDTDGMDHEVRLMEESSALAPGDTATVLRVQSGPNRRSRPVAIINHSRGVWMRGAPDATAILARSGVTRTFNWWLSMLVLLLVAAASIWTDLHVFLTEVNGPLMASVPVFDVFADLNTRMPQLTSWRLETALPSGVFDALAGLNFIPMDRLTEWGVALLGGILAVVAFAARSWRLVYVPVFAVMALISGAVLSGADVTLALTTGAMVVFLVGGLINRIRDGGRFNARVDRLAEHVMRHPPEEGVVSSEASIAANDEAAATNTTTTDTTTAAAAIAAAAVIAEGSNSETPDVESESADTESDETELESEHAELEDIAAAVDPVVEDDDLPSVDAVAEAAALSEAEANGDSDSDNDNAAATEHDAERTMTVAAPPPMPSDEAVAAPEPAPEPASETASGTEAANDEDVPDETAQSEADEAVKSSVDLSEADPEPEEPASDAATIADNDTDEATPTDAEVATAEVADEPVEAGVSDDDLVASPPAEAEAVEENTPQSADPEPVASHEPQHAARGDAPGYAPVDDPMIDDVSDPMVTATESGDLAPGAPELDFDKA